MGFEVWALDWVVLQGVQYRTLQCLQRIQGIQGIYITLNPCPCHFRCPCPCCTYRKKRESASTEIVFPMIYLCTDVFHVVPPHIASFLSLFCSSAALRVELWYNYYSLIVDGVAASERIRTACAWHPVLPDWVYSVPVRSTVPYGRRMDMMLLPGDGSTSQRFPEKLGVPV